LYVLLGGGITERNHLEVITDQLVSIMQDTRIGLGLASAQADLTTPQETQPSDNDTLEDALAQYKSGMGRFKSEQDGTDKGHGCNENSNQDRVEEWAGKHDDLQAQRGELPLYDHQ